MFPFWEADGALLPTGTALDGPTELQWWPFGTGDPVGLCRARIPSFAKSHPAGIEVTMPLLERDGLGVEPLKHLETSRVGRYTLYFPSHPYIYACLTICIFVSQDFPALTQTGYFESHARDAPR